MRLLQLVHSTFFLFYFACVSAQKWVDTGNQELASSIKLIDNVNFDTCGFNSKPGPDLETQKDTPSYFHLRIDPETLDHWGMDHLDKEFSIKQLEIKSSEQVARIKTEILDDNTLRFFIPILFCYRKVFIHIYPWGLSHSKHYTTIYLPRKCRNCYSMPNHRDGSRYLIARHGENRTNCGGRWCHCKDGTLTCDTIGCRKRREYGMLRTDSKGYDEKQILVDGFWWLHNECESSGNCGYFSGSTSWTFDSAIQHHLTYSSFAHGNSRFLPWHRKYLLDLEERLLQFHACLTLPYWDWTNNAGNEENAHVWETDYLGLPNNTNLGQFPSSSWTLPASFGTFGRGGSTGLTFGDEITVNNLFTISSYSSFRVALEGSLHGIPHVYIGGQMGSFRSPADPFFWLHHAMVDKIWYEWQYQNSGANVNSYDSALSQSISPQWSEEVSEVMDSKNDLKVCYQNPRLFPWWDVLKEIDPIFLSKISRVPQSFVSFHRSRSDSASSADHDIQNCDTRDCSVELPDDLSYFLERNGMDFRQVQKIWCFLYSNYVPGETPVRKKYSRFDSDPVVWEWLYNKHDTCTKYPVVSPISPPTSILPPTRFPTRKPTLSPTKIDPCSVYNKKAIKCKKKGCVYSKKSKICYSKN